VAIEGTGFKNSFKALGKDAEWNIIGQQTEDNLESLVVETEKDLL